MQATNIMQTCDHVSRFAAKRRQATNIMHTCEHVSRFAAKRWQVTNIMQTANMCRDALPKGGKQPTSCRLLTCVEMRCQKAASNQHHADC
eukprot:365015-Chlamydomonas_euryale.AAC.3